MYSMDTSSFLDTLNADFDTTYPDMDILDEFTDEASTLPEPHTPAVYQKQPASSNLWDPRLILDLAIGVDGLDDILPRYDLSLDEFTILSETPVFRRELALAMRDARENGLPFSRKARVQAESYLEVLDDLVYSDATPASVRLEAIRSTVKWASLEPKDEKSDGAGTGNTINVQINF